VDARAVRHVLMANHDSNDARVPVHPGPRPPHDRHPLAS